ncbi:Ribonuclease H1 [Candida viswanathii]|uniref:Ribonuclease H1 n=1 Tax=Candida viswanathii TaxID=5486 RepID=A0A367YRJ4_9ASCO|nr:Ribonuclease H1 [Candida viswanathii]
MPYYGVARGYNPGVYYNWQDCKIQVNGFSRSCYRKFTNEAAAWKFVQNNGYIDDGYSSSDDYESDPYESVGLEVVYVDGACRGNGSHPYTPAGYGVFYGYGDDRNVAVPLDEVDRYNLYRPTNQRAELHALNHALKNIEDSIDGEYCDCKTEIRSDSQFAIRSITEWCYKWSNNGWTNVRGETVANDDLIKDNFRMMNFINNAYEQWGWGEINFIHVRGHSGDDGNEQADRLANIGADNYGSY